MLDIIMNFDIEQEEDLITQEMFYNSGFNIVKRILREETEIIIN